MGNRAVNKYLDDIRRTLLAWYRIGREPVFHACYAMRLGLPVKLLIQGCRTRYHFDNRLLPESGGNLIMTSEERKEARFQRRKAKREAKRKRVLEEHGDYYKAISRNALSKSAIEAAKGVSYKASVKRYMLRRLTNVAATNKKLTYCEDIHKGFICFGLNERGKHRDIMSVHFSERVPQKSLNHNALVPVLTRSLIHDNGASQKGKGTSFAMKRLVTHLRRHYRHHGTEGYVLLFDFKNYFGNIDHGIAKQIIRRAFDDDKIVWLANRFIDSYYEHYLKMAIKKGENPDTVEHKGLGLGSEDNQTIAVSYPNKLDHYIKEVLQIHEYARYMDDGYLIHESKEYLEYCLQEIRRICAELKIELNEKKTRIVKLSHGFTFLKTQIYLTDTGKILRKPCRKAVVRQRRKLVRQYRKFLAGELSFEDIRCSYASWRGCMEKKQARRTIHSMNRLFDRLFIENWQREEVPLYG